jgi:hypothetical protein
MFGNLAAFVHEAMVEHSTCAEHGERVHSIALGAVDAAIARYDRSGAALRSAGGGTANTDSDDHCELCPASLGDGIQNGTFCTSATLVHYAPPTTLSVEARASARPIYVTAPKHGPPSQA